MAKLITAEAAARSLGISVQMVRRYCAAGRVRGAHKVGWAWLIPAPPVVLANHEVKQR